VEEGKVVIIYTGRRLRKVIEVEEKTYTTTV
jgi:predicted nucleic-acid-binding Zn-ribbon protein